MAAKVCIHFFWTLCIRCLLHSVQSIAVFVMISSLTHWLFRTLGDFLVVLLSLFSSATTLLSDNTLWVISRLWNLLWPNLCLSHEDPLCLHFMCWRSIWSCSCGMNSSPHVNYIRGLPHFHNFLYPYTLLPAFSGIPESTALKIPF